MIELLLVISIICILSALLLPALRDAREKGKTIACAGSNLKQINAVLMFYIQDYSECFPPHSATGYESWFGIFDTNYTMSRNMYHCPSHNSFAWSYTGISYGYNYRALSWPAAVTWTRLTQLTRPPEVITFADAGVDFVIAPDGYSGTNHRVSTRHNGGPNVLFADGHVAWFKFNTVDKSSWWNY